MAGFWNIHSTVTMIVIIVSVKAEKVNSIINVQANDALLVAETTKQHLNFNDLHVQRSLFPS